MAPGRPDRETLGLMHEGVGHQVARQKTRRAVGRACDATARQLGSHEGEFYGIQEKT